MSEKINDHKFVQLPITTHNPENDYDECMVCGKSEEEHEDEEREPPTWEHRDAWADGFADNH